MTGEKMLDMFEQGEAEGVYTDILVVRYAGKIWISLDGREWERTESMLIKKVLSDD